MSSSGEVAIRVEDLGKRYRVGELRTSHDTLRDALVRHARGATRALEARLRRTPARADEQSIWALRDVSFEVRQGDVLGIIGANGAGKSTLLKILTRITEPTKGEAEVHGRVGSLLEVGTGFHPELTGRENIFLYGAVLGMTRREIAAKFDEIVAFAEVDRFLDTPVKRYSTGMYLRLAFAVAAHLEPEILVVDEVLAVGDARFQKKCLAKMSELAGGGRPVLFVSHNMNAVRQLCNRCIRLQHGRLVDAGSPNEVINRYLTSVGSSTSPGEWIDTLETTRRGVGGIRVHAVRYASDRGDLAYRPYPTGPLEVTLALHADARHRITSLAVTLYDIHGTKLINADTSYLGAELELRPGRNLVRFSIAAVHLNPGVYWLGFWVARLPDVVYDFSETAVQLEIVDLVEGGFHRRRDMDGLVPCQFEVGRAEVELEPRHSLAAAPGATRSSAG